MAAVAGKFITTAKKRKLIRVLYELGLAGDVQAIKLLWSYLDGLPTAKIEASGTLSYTQDPGWVHLRGVLIELAEAYPEARARLLEAIHDSDGS